jgi:biopolymer transport protein ExbB/TolQ
MKPPRQSASTASRSSRSPFGWLFGWMGSREIDRRVMDDFPSWQDFAQQTLKAAQERKEAEQFKLPPHRVYVSSPLHWNFMYLLGAGGAVVLGIANAQWANYLIYGAIFSAFAVAIAMVLRDGAFFHMEGHRLEMDGEMINKHAEGEASEEGKKEKDKKAGILGVLSSKSKNMIFRSKLLQIHYQNILRTFEAGNRRTWVYQDASIADIQTLLSQRGMKLAWTLIEVLPQLGLLGTLIGMTQMFQSFRGGAGAPSISILSGFATALGTTLLANLFVLVLRPLHMRNERSMQEILSTLQMLMAMFILPTQQSVLERTTQAPAASPYAGHTGYGPPVAAVADRRLSESLERLSDVVQGMAEVRAPVDGGALAQDTAEIAQNVRDSLSAFRDMFDARQFDEQRRSFTRLTEAVQMLATKIERPAPELEEAPRGRMEVDLLQLRMLTRDTLVLLDQISGQLAAMGGAQPKLLSNNPRLAGQVFLEAGEADQPDAPRHPEDDRQHSDKVRLFRER